MAPKFCWFNTVTVYFSVTSQSSVDWWRMCVWRDFPVLTLRILAPSIHSSFLLWVLGILFIQLAQGERDRGERRHTYSYYWHTLYFIGKNCLVQPFPWLYMLRVWIPDPSQENVRSVALIEEANTITNTQENRPNSGEELLIMKSNHLWIYSCLLSQQ